MKSRVKVKRTPDKALKELEKMQGRFKGPNGVKVGLPAGSNDYPDGTNVIMVGAIHEFGSPAQGVPQRSFLRSTIKSNRRKYKRFLKALAKQIIDGKITKQKAIQLLGLRLQTDVRDRITDIKTPPLKSRSGNPLVDTGHLRQTITFQVGD